MSADKVTEDLQPMYADLLMREQKRLDKWAGLISDYEEGTLEQCETFLSNSISKRYLLCHFDEFSKKFKYIQPQIGLTFRAAIEKSTKSYPNIRAFSWNVGKCDIYSDLEVYEPQEDDIEYAKQIRESWIEAKERYVEEQKEKQSKKKLVITGKELVVTEHDEDDEPW